MWLCVFIVPKDVEVVFRKESVVDGVQIHLCMFRCRGFVHV